MKPLELSTEPKNYELVVENLWWVGDDLCIETEDGKTHRYTDVVFTDMKTEYSDNIVIEREITYEQRSTIS